MKAQDVYFGKQVYHQAVAYCRAFLQIAPNTIDTADKLKESFSTDGDVYFEKQDYPQAAAYYQAVLQMDSHNVEVADKLREAFTANGDVSCANTKYQKSIELWKQDIETKPDAWSSNWNMGRIHLYLNEIDKAIECLIRALKAGQDIASSYFMYFETGTAYLAKNDYDTALEYYTKGIERCIEFYTKHPKVKPDSHEFFRIGERYRQQKNHDRATEFYRKALKIDSNNNDAAENLRALNKKQIKL
jgi:tetratricopeptide (TPR) repeat protein